MRRSKGSNRRADLARIHCLKRDLGLDDETYREILSRVCGVASAGDLDDQGRLSLIAHLGRLAAPQGAPAPKTYPGRPDNLDERRSLRKIEALLADAGRPWDYAHSIARRMHRVDRVQWCTDAQLRGVIAALWRDAKRHDREPDES